MNNKEFSLIFKGISHILSNQEQIMKHLGEENFYRLNDTNDLSVMYSELAKAYFEADRFSRMEV